MPNTRRDMPAWNMQHEGSSLDVPIWISTMDEAQFTALLFKFPQVGMPR